MLVLMDWALFQSTSSMWRTTPNKYCWLWRWQISIHVLHVEDDTPSCDPTWPEKISIHVLHVEDDVWEPYTFDFAFVISIHVLHVEDDLGTIYI